MSRRPQRVETTGMKSNAQVNNWLPVDKTASSVIKPACETMGLRLVAEEHKRAEWPVIGRLRVLAMGD